MEDKQKPTNTTKIYPDTVGHSISEEKQQNHTAMAMADLEIMKSESAKSAADQNPEIRKVALLLAAVLGINLFSQISSFLIVKSFDTTQSSFLSTFVSTNGLLGITLLLVQAVAIFTLLFTKNASHAKTIILVASISFGITLVKGIFSFGIGPAMVSGFATLVVNFLLFRKIFKLYLDL